MAALYKFYQVARDCGDVLRFERLDATEFACFCRVASSKGYTRLIETKAPALLRTYSRAQLETYLPPVWPSSRSGRLANSQSRIRQVKRYSGGGTHHKTPYMGVKTSRTV